VRVLQFQSYDLRGSDEQTLRGEEKSDFMRVKRLESINELAKLENDPFEPFLKTHYPDALKYIHNLLKKIHAVTVDLNPKYFHLGLDEISDERQFDLAIIRVIAGATVVTLDPAWFSYEGPAAGALDWVKPSKKLQTKMRIALEVTQEEGIVLPQTFERQLRMLAHGRPLISQYKPTEKLLQLVVREITLINNQLFTISNSGKNRFPVKAIVAIGEILNLNLPTERTIYKMQETIEAEVDPNEFPLSDNISNISP
tara:strand:- start:969 stop:1733 length:765 start_codon:yes stop_codon:yes gene_type:complete